MKHTLYNIMRACMLFVALSLPGFAFADDNTGNVDAAESAAMARTKANAPVWQETDPTVSSDPTQTNTPYLNTRRALVGYNCQINRIITSVGVGSWQSSIGNLVDEDLDNDATFPGVVSAEIVTSPIVGVRDLDNYYAAGTTVGFCIVANSGTTVLALDVIKSMHIWLYCDGVRVDDLTVREGNSGSGVKLSLIGVGNDQACVNLTAVSTQKFDEVVLVQGAGLNAEVGGVVKVKYAFVGDAHDIYMTTNGISDYCTETGHAQMDVSCEAYMPSPLVGGIPLSVTSSYCARAIDDDLTNTVPLVSAVQLASVAFKGRVRINVENDDDSVSELFNEGDQVGFKFNTVEIANVLSLGAWIDIKLYDHSGNDVQTTTVSAEGLALALASGGDQTSYIVAEQPFSGAEITFYTALGVLDLGSGFGVYYGFVRPKPSVEKHHCPINASYGVNICDQQSTYQLLHNDEVPVRWEIAPIPNAVPTGSAVTVSEDGYIRNMDLPGDYTFRAYSTTDNCYEDVTIHHGIDADPTQCERPIENSQNNYELSTSAHGVTGSLISVSDLQNSENILDGQVDTYATYTGGLAVADNLMIVGVTTADGSPMFQGNLTSQKPMRIGFVMEVESTGLDLNAVNLFNIRCFNGETQTYSAAITDVAVVNVGVAGSSKEEKIRFVIEVPKVDGNGTPIVFNEFQLWKSGVLGLAIDNLNIYYPFTEEVSDDPTTGCRNAIMEGSNILNYADDYASVSAENIGVVAVADVTNNLSNIIDYDETLETYATIVKGAGSGQTVISVKMGHIQDFRQQVGVVIDNTSYVNVKVGGVLEVATYMDGDATGDSQNTWEAIGVNAIGSGDQAVLLINPTKNYDEIRITITNGLTVAQTLKIFGIILRNDIDHDGVADNRDPSSCDDTIAEIEVKNACLNGNIHFEGTTTTSTDFYFIVEDQATATQSERFNVTSSSTGVLALDVPATKVGHDFTAYIYNGSDNLVGTATYTVHPLKTMWKLNPVDTNWNEWNNWTEGSPYLCTDVIIPSNAAQYPSLDEEVVNGDEFGCDRIYFESRAAVEKVYKLNYTKAWVDVELAPNRYYLLAAPLQNMYTGDMFIAETDPIASRNDYFTALNGNTYMQNRFDPRVYQRLWEKAADVKLSNGELSEGTATIQETRWSKRFNALKYDYKQGEGFSVWADPEDNEATAFTFRFPKEQTAYNYYNEITREATAMEETDLVRTNGYRFAYEQGNDAGKINYTYLSADDRKVYSNIGNVTITATAAEPTTTFLIGNPFMSHIDIQEFLSQNSDNIAEVKTYNGNTTSSATAVGGTLISTDSRLKTILPMEAFYVTAKAQATTLSVVLTPSMFQQQREDNISPSRIMAYGYRNDFGMLRITAETDDCSASTILLQGAEGVATATLFDDEVRPRIALFTLCGSQALDIRNIETGTNVPLGVYMPENGQLKLNFKATGAFNLEGYTLLDQETGITYDLTAPIVIDNVTSSMSRFVLLSGNTTAIDTTSGVTDLQVRIDGDEATVHSHLNDITLLAVFTTDGREVSKAKSAGAQQLSVRLADGVNLIRIQRHGQADEVYKVMKR